MNLLNLSKTTIRVAAIACFLCAAAVQAQTVYRIVGADGRVTFSDKAPVNAEQGKVATTGVGSAAAAAAANLPFELRQIASRYPVTLYASPECAPCNVGRSMLVARGIPYSERSVTTAEDSAALKRLSGETALPFLTIGGQRIKGYSELEWTQYLDAAGYPKASTLPASYRQAPVMPLVSMEKAPAKAEERPVERSEPVQTPGPTPSNPAGIQF